MTKLRRSRGIRLAALSVLAAWLPAGMATRTLVPAAPTFADQAPRKGELFLRDGTSRQATEIFVVGDSIVAHRPDEAGAGVEPPMRLARSDVLGVRERYQKEPESTLLIAGLLVGLGLGAYWLGSKVLSFRIE